MCTECVGEVVALDLDRREATVDTGAGRSTTASLVVADLEGVDVAVGAWVQVHTGFVLATLDADDGRALRSLADDARAAGAGDARRPPTTYQEDST